MLRRRALWRRQRSTRPIRSRRARCARAPTSRSRVQAYTKKAIAEKLTDQQVRDVEIGKAHIGIGVVHRGKLDAPAPDSVAEHDQVSEVYHIIDGSATLVLGPDIVGKKRRPATLETVRLFNGPGNNGSSIRNGVTHELKAGDVIVIPGRHRPLVHEDRRSHHLPDGPHRSRQGDAAQGRGGVEGVSFQASRQVRLSSQLPTPNFQPPSVELGLGVGNW